MRIGVGVHCPECREHPRRLLETLLAHAHELALDLECAEPIEWHFGLMPAERFVRSVVADGLVAAGDAASQATLVIGEGIRLSLEAGELAGSVVAAAVRRGRSDRAALRPYEVEFWARSGHHLALGCALNRRISTYSDPEWDRAVSSLGVLPPSLVADILLARVSLRSVLTALVRRPRAAAQLARLPDGGVQRHRDRNGLAGLRLTKPLR
jgi:digeranylgeranylglycerophospholipid reductase